MKSYRCRVFGTPRTLRKLGSQTTGRTQRLTKGQGLTRFDDLFIENFAVEHDAPEACGFRITSGGTTYGHLTDAGQVTPRIVDGLQGCHVLGIEFNHDLKMLHEGPYPDHLKVRVAGPLGHLDNLAAANLLADIDHQDLRHVFLLHSSKTNNTSNLALAAAQQRLPTDRHVQIRVAEQDAPIDAVTCSGSELIAPPSPSSPPAPRSL